jgi:hypothetical protein
MFLEGRNGYVLSYDFAYDNTHRKEFFHSKEDALKKAEELKEKDYVGLTSIESVTDYHEWVNE